jgi:hypothetical protein
VYVTLRGRWCDVIVLNAHAPTKDNIADVKDRFYEVRTSHGSTKDPQNY